MQRSATRRTWSARPGMKLLVAALAIWVGYAMGWPDPSAVEAQAVRALAELRPRPAEPIVGPDAEGDADLRFGSMQACDGTPFEYASWVSDSPQPRQVMRCPGDHYSVAITDWPGVGHLTVEVYQRGSSTRPECVEAATANVALALGDSVICAPYEVPFLSDTYRHEFGHLVYFHRFGEAQIRFEQGIHRLRGGTYATNPFEVGANRMAGLCLNHHVAAAGHPARVGDPYCLVDALDGTSSFFS
jgi:hypothetical protein